MTSELFYALLKLVSGEEILAKVCAFVENDEVLIVMDNPIIVKLITQPKSKAPLVKVEPWISLSLETTHIIRRKNVITMTEVKDESLVNIHEQYVKKLNKPEDVHTKGNSQIMSVKEARKTFERLYNQESHSSFE